jgi:hypothetical protein
MDCPSACAKIVMPACSHGPPSAALCEAICNATLSGNDATCKAALEGVLGCMTPSSTMACDAKGNPTSVGCEAEFTAFVPCVPGGAT